jgi:hypothetical protein
MKILEALSVSKQYGKPKVVDGLSVQVHHGEFIRFSELTGQSLL